MQQGDNPASLADLYGPLTMPPVLLKAHQKLDAVVDAAFLFEPYRRDTSFLPTDKKKPVRKKA